MVVGIAPRSCCSTSIVTVTSRDAGGRSICRLVPITTFVDCAISRGRLTMAWSA
jgi:hypothetical protein